MSDDNNDNSEQKVPQAQYVIQTKTGMQYQIMSFDTVQEVVDFIRDSMIKREPLIFPTLIDGEEKITILPYDDLLEISVQKFAGMSRKPNPRLQQQGQNRR